MLQHRKLSLLIRIIGLCGLIGLLSLEGCAKKSNEDPLAQFQNQSAEQIFREGEQALASGDYAIAIKDFEALDALYPFGSYTKQSQMDLIYAYYKSDDAASVIVTADRFLRLYPRDPNAAYVLYMKGLVEQKQGMGWMQQIIGIDPAPRDPAHLQQAFQDFSQLVAEFPNSRYTASALQHMREIRNILARKELSAAQYYFARKAYVAAANRATYIVQHFPNSPAVIDALELLINSYQKLHLPLQQRQAQQLLQVYLHADTIMGHPS